MTDGGEMHIEGLDSLIIYVADLDAARKFYVEVLDLPVVFEDEVIVVVGGAAVRLVLHRNDRGHDARGIFPAGATAGAAALRFAVADPDACEAEAAQRGVPVVWSCLEASWGRFVVLADPDGRPVVLARMRTAHPREGSLENPPPSHTAPSTATD